MPPALLRLATAGSVDDGKSTLIGRLLYDSKSLMADQVPDAEVDLARLTDGLRAEREQGITIDVAYRFFATPKRSFIIADTPGHVRYTRNMVTGASTAQAALVLVDAVNGLLEQSHRHAYISSLLGIRHMVACVNKMDLVDWDEDRFREISAGFQAMTGAARGAGRADDPDVGARGRQRRRALLEHALLRRAAAARAPRGDRGRLRPQLRRRALPGAADDPRARQLAGRLPRLRGADGGRRAAAWRRGGRAPDRRPHDDRADRRAGGRRLRGVPADVGHRGAGRRPRRQPRRPDVPAGRRPAGDAAAAGADLLDDRRPAAPRRSASGSSTRRAACARRSSRSTPASTSLRCARSRCRASWRSTTSGACTSRCRRR